MSAVHMTYQMMANGGKQGTASDESLLQLLPQVHYIASRIHERLPQQVDLEDLVQVGVIGLIEASRSFDSSKNAQFGTYATFRIKGAILDALRSQDWASRRTRDKAREIAETRHEMESALGRTPTSEELAEEMGLSLAKLNELQADLHGLHLVNQVMTSPGEDGEQLDLIEAATGSWENPFEAYAKAELMGPLVAAVASLTEREQLILSLYYQDELTMREVAEVVGIAASRVCDIHTRTLKKLRMLLSPTPQGKAK